MKAARVRFLSVFAKLKEKWKVGWFQFIIIFTTFALGGSLCARTGSFILNWLLPEKNVWYWIVYVPLVTLIWPLCVLLVSIPLGQFRFFMGYLKKMGVKMGLVKDSPQAPSGSLQGRESNTQP